MERRWKINGAYATWTLTVHADPPETDDEDEAIPDERLVEGCKEARFTGLVSHFHEVINNWEFCLLHDDSYFRS